MSRSHLSVLHKQMFYVTMSINTVIFGLVMVNVVHCATDELSTLMTSLWHSDINAAASKDLRYAYQQHANTTSTADNAPESLFTYVNEDYLYHKPTYLTFLDLLNNYNHATGTAEHVTPEEEAEELRFIREICKTSVMQKTQEFLHTKGFVGSTMTEFEHTLSSIWFSNYPRRGHSSIKDSSGFEHVFVGETVGTKVDGLHNWIQFHMEEKAGHLNYLGYLYKREPAIIGVHFKWFNNYKNLSGLIVGTSPEFDIAAYTICYYLHRNRDCSFNIDAHNIRIKTYEVDYVNGDQVATAYVE